MKKLVNKDALLRQVYLNSKAALCIGLSLLTALAPSISLALEVKIQRTVNLRTDETSSLRKVGMLAAGSIVSIPDQYAVRKNGAVDFDLTLNNWLSKASTLASSESAGLKAFSGAKKDFYFPVKVVKAAPGSQLGNQDSYMVALHYLQRKGALLETTENAELTTADTATGESAASDIASEVATAEAVSDSVSAPAAVSEKLVGSGSGDARPFEASAMAECTDCQTDQSLHPLALRLQLSLDSNLRKPLEKMTARTARHTDDAEARFEKTCGMRLQDFISALRREISASPLRATVPAALNSTMMLGLMTQETTGDCNAKGDHGTSYGLFQVNGKSSGFSREQLRHPITNARAALNNLESKQRALSKDFDFSKMTEDDRLRILISSYNGGEKWVRRAKEDLEQFNRRQGTSLNAHNWEHLRVFYFRRHLNSSNEAHAFGTVRGKDQRSTKNALSNLAYTENLIPRPNAARGVTLQDAWNRRVNG